ncbi:HAD family hydrolase [archaeon]|nr:MAG: HAD family hydrolase [archaeon]
MRMEQKISVLRDGRAQYMVTRYLVPGDVVLLRGGDVIPADMDWIEGDTLSIDTSPLTGESIPRKYPSEQHGRRIYSGCTVLSGEAYTIIRSTGSHTEIGKSQEAVMQDKATKKISVFESKVLFIVKGIIFLAIIDVLILFVIQGTVQGGFTLGNIQRLFLTVLSILVASVPVALPLVLQVTMALGAGVMATKYDAVVTSLPALQDISSMTILCSDKTGTLTTARISILRDRMWTTEGFSIDDLLLYTRLASNADKEEDPVDRACLGLFDQMAPISMKSSLRDYRMRRTVGFNPIYKRTLWVYSHAVLGEVWVAKGLPNKVIDTADGGQDDAEDQWRVENCFAVMEEAMKRAQEFSVHGYKTVGVAVRFGHNEPFKFVGLLPMIDPPRHDTAKTIAKLRNAGVKVKMVTGDQLNIAQETARLIGLDQTHFYRSRDIQTEEGRDAKILDASGFAEVLPQDKRLIVTSLKGRQQVVGMTGDGVNDVSALSAAQCGIAVEGATDAAKNAAAILLTAPGLSAVYNALVESRRIFRKLRAYIVYRIAATIQIVTSLTLVIYIANCAIDPLLIVLLALFNDLTMMPIAYDPQKAAATPDYPNVRNIVFLAVGLGAMQTVFTMLWTFVSPYTNFFRESYDIFSCSTQAQGGFWLQLVLSTEFLIFSTRAPHLIWNGSVPSIALICAVALGCILLSVLALTVNVFGSLYIGDILILWLYCIITFILVDLGKLAILSLLGEASFKELVTTEVEDEKEAFEQEPEEKLTIAAIPEEETKEPLPRKRSSLDLGRRGTIDLEAGARSRAASQESMEDQLDKYIRLSSRLRSFNRWVQQGESTVYEDYVTDAIELQNRRTLSDTIEVLTEGKEQRQDLGLVSAKRTTSAPGALRQRYAPPPHAVDRARNITPLQGSFVATPDYTQSTGEVVPLRRHSTSLSIRPHTPATLATYLTDRHRLQFKGKI